MTMIQSYERQKIIREQAEQRFERSWLIGNIKRLIGKITHKEYQLTYLGDLNPRDYTPHRLERQPIPIHKIRGTSGRLDRFDSDFHPIMRRDKGRWTGVAGAMMEDPTQLPAIELVRVGDVYYVLDGHHRISVARALGKLFIDANLMCWEPN